MATVIGRQVSSGNRTHIGFFGRMNSGKSSLVNAFSGTEVSIVSPRAGTTTDAVRKPMEIHGIGACLLIDTAGFDDAGDVGELRVKAARKARKSTDIAVILFPPRTADRDAAEKAWTEEFLRRGIPVIGVVSMADTYDEASLRRRLSEISRLSIPSVAVSARTKKGIGDLRSALIAASAEEGRERSVTAGLAVPGDTVVLVMPQDPQAPEGRLIQPEVQTIRDLLDKHCVVLSVQPAELGAALASLRAKPKLVVTDSQAFPAVAPLVPPETMLTSFSILFAAYKGDVAAYRAGAEAIDALTEDSHVLIAEICSHVPMSEDIGREKIPALLRKRAGSGLKISVVSGSDFPDDLSPYDLVIQCGGCMFNRAHVLSRIRRALAAGVPITNYGIALAYMSGILEKVALPGDSSPGEEKR